MVRRICLSLVASSLRENHSLLLLCSYSLRTLLSVTGTCWPCLRERLQAGEQKKVFRKRFIYFCLALIGNLYELRFLSLWWWSGNWQVYETTQDYDLITYFYARACFRNIMLAVSAVMHAFLQLLFLKRQSLEYFDDLVLSVCRHVAVIVLAWSPIALTMARWRALLVLVGIVLSICYFPFSLRPLKRVSLPL